MTIIFTEPVLTCLVARIALKESLSYGQMFLVLISTIGVVLAARPPLLGFENRSDDDSEEISSGFSRQTVVGIGLFGALSSAASNVVLRTITEVNGVVVVSWFMLTNICVSFAMTCAFVSEPTAPSGFGTWAMLAAVGCLGFAGQSFRTYGLRWEKAGVGTMMHNLTLVLSFVFQSTILHEEMNMLSLLGAVMMLSASVSVGALKIRDRRRQAMYMHLETCDPPVACDQSREASS